MTEGVSVFGFAVIAALAIAGSLGVVLSRNVVNAAFWLLGTSIVAAAVYFLLAADFIALLQLLVYAAAVAVLNIFTIMLTLRRREDAIRPRDWSWPAAGMAALFGGLVLTAVSRSATPTGRMPLVAPDVAAFGKLLFTSWMLPFELASLVLLVALVGAVWWSKEGDDR